MYTYTRTQTHKHILCFLGVKGLEAADERAAKLIGQRVRALARMADTVSRLHILIYAYTWYIDTLIYMWTDIVPRMHEFTCICLFWYPFRLWKTL